MSRYYPGCAREALEGKLRQGMNETAAEDLATEAVRDQDLWAAEAIASAIDQAPARIYSLFVALVHAAAPSVRRPASPEDDWFYLVGKHRRPAFITSIPFACYQLAEEIVMRTVPADEEGVEEAKAWLSMAWQLILQKSRDAVAATRDDE